MAGALRKRSEPLPREWLPIPPAHSSTAVPLRRGRTRWPWTGDCRGLRSPRTRAWSSASSPRVAGIARCQGRLGFRGAAAGGAASRPRGSSHSGTPAGACFLRRRGIPSGGRSLGRLSPGGASQPMPPGALTVCRISPRDRRGCAPPPCPRRRRRRHRLSARSSRCACAVPRVSSRAGPAPPADGRVRARPP